MRASRALAAVLVAGWALGPLAPAPLAADDPGAAAKKQAGALFRAGEEAYRKHRYGDAADAFEGAYRVVPHPASMSNAIDARTRAGENARAAELCASLLRELGPGGSEKERIDAERRLAELLPKVGRLVLEGEGASDVAIDGRPAALGTHYVEPGDHLVRAKARGVPVERALSVPAGAVQRVVLEAPPPPAPPAPPAPAAPSAQPAAAPAAPARPPAVDVGPAEEPRGKPLAPTWFFAGLGATAVAGGFALWSGLDTLEARDAWDANPTAEGLEAGRDKQLRTNVLLGATAGLALVSGAVAVFATDWSGGGPKRAEGRAGASLRAGPGGVTLRVRF